jgi:hypothetical protein
MNIRVYIYKDGFIVTNAHVVEHSKDGRCLITMWDSRKRQGIVHRWIHEFEYLWINIYTYLSLDRLIRMHE